MTVIGAICTTFSIEPVPPFGEEHLVEMAGRQLGDQSVGFAPGVVGEGGCDGAHFLRLLDNCRDNFWVQVADVDVEQLRPEVQVTATLVVGEV